MDVSLDDEEDDELGKFLVGAASTNLVTPRLFGEVKAIVGAILARKQELDVATVSQGW